MSEQLLHKASPLVWLRAEIVRSIDASRHSLTQALAQRTERAQWLDRAAAQIREVRGALLMLDLDGASCFCKALEEAMRSAPRSGGDFGELTVSVMDRALFALHQYLADLAQGEPDTPLKLYPVHREVTELWGRKPASEAELFFPDLAGASSALTPRMPTIHPSTRAAHIAACCTLFQRGLVAWLKQASRHAGIGMMHSALDGMHRACDGSESHPGLWAAATGLVELLAAPDARLDPAQLNVTLGRVERAMRAASAGTAVDWENLMREILYPIAVSPPVNERGLELKALYRLDAQIPEFCVSGTLEYDIRTLAPVIEEMRSLLTGIEQAWTLYASGSRESLGSLRDGLARLKTTARDLGHYRLVRLLDIVTMIVSKLPEPVAFRNEALSLEMAATFLFMEGMLDHFTDPPHDIDQQVAVMAGWLLDAVQSRSASRVMSGTPRDDATQRQHFAEIRTQVVCEIQENLLRAEELIEQVARGDAPAERIAGTDRQFAQVAGALKMLGLNRANGVLSASVHLLKLCAGGEPELKETTLAWAADGLSCLGFYLDALRRGITPNDDLLLDFVRRLANESEPPAGSTGWIPAAANPAELSSTTDEPLIDAVIEPLVSDGSADTEPLETSGSDVIDPHPPGDPTDAMLAAAGPDDSPVPEIAPNGSLSEATALDAEPSTSMPTTEARTPPAPEESPDLALVPVFLDEARILLGRLYSDLGAWRNAPREIRGARAFARTLHTLKGSARLIGAMRLGDFTHSVESYVGETIERGERDEEAFDFAPLQQMLVSIAEHIAMLEALREPGSGAHEATRPNRPPPLPQADALDAPSTVRVPISVLNGLVNHAGETSEVRARTEDEVGTMRRSLHELAETVTRLRVQLREFDKATERLAQAFDAGINPVDSSASCTHEVEHRTRLQELSRAMAETLYDVQTLQQGLAVNCTETEAALALQGRLDRTMRHKLLEIRSLPFGSLAQRLQRTVLQTASQLEREAVLLIEGESVHIDRNVLQRLAAPLEHMLRNAVAHGIESPAQRIAAGKSAVGTVRLVIEQNDDENVLTLSDDGAGLDIAQIHNQAVHLGLVQSDDALSDRMLHSLIFAPGLSTASTVTAAAGRGVGLDVVRAEVRALGGSIEVTSERTRGVCFRIRFPTSLSYTQALLVRAANALYAIPATLVDQVCELPPDELSAARESGCVPVLDRPYRFVDLGRLLGSPTSHPPRRSNSVLLLHGDGEHAALHVDQVVRKQAIELKSIGPQLARVRGIAGATIVGKGDVVLILDPNELIMHAQHRFVRETHDSSVSGAAAPHVILVVDDSLTMRRSTTRLLVRAGYQVLVAKDGIDALQQIEEALPDLVIADIEMPNMDGFELTSHLRSDPRTARIPIVIVTSRIAEKHRTRAAELGVDGFFGKPYAEEKLLADVVELLDRRAQS